MHQHAQNAPFEWFLSTTGLLVVSRLLSETCWLRIQWLTYVMNDSLAGPSRNLVDWDGLSNMAHVTFEGDS